MGNSFLLIFAVFLDYFKKMSVSSQLMHSTFSLLSFYFSFLEF